MGWRVGTADGCGEVFAPATPPIKDERMQLIVDNQFTEVGGVAGNLRELAGAAFLQKEGFFKGNV